MKQYAKAIMAAIGAAITAAAGLVAADSTVGKVLTVAAAAVTVLGVYLVPNAAPPVPTSAQHLAGGTK